MFIERTNSKINLNLFINYIFGFFPISFILGNAILNANLIFFCLLGIYQLKSKILKEKFDYIFKLIFFLFLMIIFSTGLSLVKSLYLETYETENWERFLKSLLFLRFFLMIFVTYLLCKFDILNVKFFFVLAAICSVFISLDIIFQYYFEFNIAGFKPIDIYHNTGFFGDEIIAGGYIQSFSIFSIMLSTLILKDKKYLKFILITLLICILSLGIIYSGNRMPFIIFLLGLILIFIFKKNLRFIISTSLLILAVILKFEFSQNENLKITYISLYHNTIGQVILVVKNYYGNNSNEENLPQENEIIKTEQKNNSLFTGTSHQVKLLITGIEVWKRNKIFGNGMKSFRYDCIKLVPQDDPNFLKEFSGVTERRAIALSQHKVKKFWCSFHPHNYYMQVLVELGVVGFVTMLLIAILFIIFIFKNFLNLRENKFENLFILSCTICLFLEMFPIQSTGSIFTTGNATYITLISSLVVSYKKIIKTKNF